MTSTLESKASDVSYRTTDGAELFCRVKGNGDELILFLHAVGGDLNGWAPQLEHFSKKFTCAAFDMRGHSRSKLSDKKNPQEANPERFALDAAFLIEQLGFRKAHIVGLSMGGVTALFLHSLRPELVQSLTLANTWCYQAEAEGRIAFMENQLANKSMTESARELIPGLFAKTAKKDIIESVVAQEGGKDKEVYLASWRSMFKVDFREHLKNIHVPTLLIGGGEDGITPTEPLLTEIAALMPMAQLKELPGCGHFTNLEGPKMFNEALEVNLRRARSKNGTRLMPVQRKEIQLETDTTAHALMRLLSLRGIEFFFSNSGTDFTPIIDALARYNDDPDFNLTTIVAPHENTAIAMTHGYFLVSKRMQASMAHVNVGTANMGLGLINASRSRIPMLLMAGRTPWYDSDVEGCRTNFVQWGQDTFDQGAYFREFTKWDYELKGPNHLETVVDRALAISASDPQGPAYLILPKESLCSTLENVTVSSSPSQSPAAYGSAPCAEVYTAAQMILKAKHPVIVTAEAGRYVGGPQALLALSDRFAIPVIEHGKHNFFNFPTNHDMHLGFNPSPYVEDADLIIAVECPVPWIPELSNVKTPPLMVHIGVDPLYQRIPMRGFPIDCALTGDPGLTLASLRMTLEKAIADDANHPFMDNMKERLRSYSSEHKNIFEKAKQNAKLHESRTLITKDYLSYAIGEVVDDDVVIFNEYNLEPTLVPRHLPDSWFENSIASGLGWALGAALGGQLASRSQTMMVTLGDGTYLFNTPLSAHYVAAAYKLPIVIVVFNDSAWSTIKKSYKGTTPDGWGQKTGHMPLCDFDLTIGFEQVAQSCGGIGLRVESPSHLIPKLKEALHLSRTEGRHVLVNVICERDG